MVPTVWSDANLGVDAFATCGVEDSQRSSSSGLEWLSVVENKYNSRPWVCLPLAFSSIA